MEPQITLFFQAGPAAWPWLLALARASSEWLPTIALAGTAVAAIASGKEARKGLLALALALALAWLLARGIRATWPSARPFAEGHGAALLAHGPSASFPSMHATAGAAWAVAVPLLLKARRRWAVAALVAAVLIGWSRVYLHLHYVSDVAAGWLLGSACTVVAWLGWTLLGRRYAQWRIRTGRAGVRPA